MPELDHHPRAPQDYRPGAATYRCLSFDGGPNTLVDLWCLRHLEARIPGFLARTQLFAGTSDGAFAALSLARFPAPGVEALDATIALIEDFARNAVAPPSNPRLARRLGWLPGADRALRGLTGLRGMARMASGTKTWSDGVEAGAVLSRHLRDADGRVPTLGDLPNDVCAVTYQLRAAGGGGAFRQRPRIYQNIDRTDADSRESVLDVARRTSALPLFLPVYQGHVDGALFANNPTMCAIATAMAQRSRPSEGRFWHLKDMVVMSMGADDLRFGSPAATAALAEETAAWGWRRWLLAGPNDLLLLMDVLLNGDAGGVSYQALQLLGERFLRVAPPAQQRIVDRFIQVVRGGVEDFILQARRTADAWADEWDPAALADERLHDPRARTLEEHARTGKLHPDADVDLRGTTCINATVQWARRVWMPGPA